MSITKISKNAFAILAECSQTKRCFGITVDPTSSNYYSFVWAFPINQQQAHKEGFDSQHIRGAVTLDPNYNGCPHCGRIGVFQCYCGAIACWDGTSRTVVCPHCNNKLSLSDSSDFDLKGGSY